MAEAPLTLATLVDAPAVGVGGGGGARAASLHLAPDVMHACRLGTGELVLRAVRSGAAAAAAAAAAGGLAALGGTGAYHAALRDLVTLPLRSPELFARFRLRPPRGLLLHGPPGSGKTALARAAAADAGAALLVVNGPDVMSEFLGESEAGLQGVFAAARALAPAVVLLDEIDALAPARGGGGGGGGLGASAHAAAAGGGGGGDAQARVLTTLLMLMDGVGAPGGASNSNSSPTSDSKTNPTSDRVVVIGATNRRDAIDGALRRPGRLEREIEVGVPGPGERREILEARLARVRHSLDAAQVSSLAGGAHGFVSADLAALVDEAALCALRRVVAAREEQGRQQQQQAQQQRQGQGVVGQQQQQQQAQEEQRQACDGDSGGGGGGGGGGELSVEWRDFAAAQARVKPSALREVAVELPQVSWSDVGGLGDVKQRLKEAVEWPQRHPDALARLGATPPRGILLYGPPGCSKTLLARAVASEARLNFLSVKGGELHSKWVGGGERAVAALFARARAAAPAVVFFDELDGLAGARPMGGGGGGGGGSGGAGERVLAQLLMELDGLQPRLGVVVLAATNRPDRVDAALLRPGRFDRLLRVPPPGRAARSEIFAVHLRATPLAADVDLSALGAAAEGYTGADVAAACREAALAALDEDLGAAAVAPRHFAAALARVPPSAGPGAALEDIYKSFERAGRVESL
ncbi:MAG: P-loop containing nucleoside triphosphate hydrolase protein [Monoraphidium minutum]|nr:MAG: P-loop containing nucleoside triphosphate hydrolase protein [Monoraphidium minutum]